MRKKKEKTPQPSTEGMIPSKDRFFDYLCIFSQKKKPMHLKGIEQLAQEVVQWATEDDEALKISQFYFKKGFSQSCWQLWCKHFPELQQAHDAAKAIIGNRREIGGLKKKFDTNLVARSMVHYDNEWKGSEIWRASLRQPKDELTGPQFVIIEKSPETDIVPKRITKEEK